MIGRIFIAAVVMSMASSGCAHADGGEKTSNQARIDKARELYAAGDSAGAIALMDPLKTDADPEIRFSIGYLHLEKSQDPAASKQRQSADLKVALDLIKGAARENLQQAASFLASAYEWGDYGLPKDPAHASCWRAVAGNHKSGDECMK